MINEAELNTIRRLLGEFKSDKEIIDHLKINDRTFYRYKKKIMIEDKKKLDNEADETREYNIMMVKRAIQYCISINKKICDDPETSAADKRESSIVISKAYIALMNAENNGIAALTNNERMMIRGRGIGAESRIIQ